MCTGIRKVVSGKLMDFESFKQLNYNLGIK
jgi:hypothetical protein